MRIAPLFAPAILANEVYDNFLKIKSDGQMARGEWSGSCKDRAQWRNLFGDEENGYLGKKKRTFGILWRKPDSGFFGPKFSFF